jgi:peptidoglycan/xylan/chitin deacetylase (PgdA/CDA1 family)
MIYMIKRDIFRKRIFSTTFILLFAMLIGCSVPADGPDAADVTPSFTPSPAPSCSTPVLVSPSSPSPSQSSAPPSCSPDEKLLKPDTAVIIFTFDDGPESDYLLAYPILKEQGIKGTSYIITKFTDESMPGKLTWDQIKEMSADGWDFGCHTYEHKRLTGMSDDEIKESMEAVDRSFTEQGFQPPSIMAYPYGAYNQRVIDDIKPYRAQARLASYQTMFVDPKNTDPYAIDSVSADMRTNSQLKKDEKLVDKACGDNAVIVFRIHTMYKEKPYDTVPINKKILSGCAPQTDSRLFRQLVEYCVDKGCSFMTMSQLMDVYKQGQ